MKTFLTWVIVLGAFGAGAGYLINTYKEDNAELGYKLALTDLKRDFHKKAMGLAYLEPDVYRSEVGVLLTEYFKKVDELGKRFPGQQDIQRERKKTAADAQAGRLKEGQEQQKEERIALTLDLYDKLRSGQYRPLYTVADKAFRFDIYELGRAKLSGEDRIKLAYVHWGAFGPMTYNLIEGNVRADPVQGKPAEVEKIVGEMQPPSLQVDPERWVLEFIPGVEIGYYDLPLFSKTAKAVELSFDMTTQTAGGTPVPLHLKFPDVPIADSWRVDGNWQAETQEVSAEEMRAAGAKVEEKK